MYMYFRQTWEPTNHTSFVYLWVWNIESTSIIISASSEFSDNSKFIFRNIFLIMVHIPGFIPIEIFFWFIKCPKHPVLCPIRMKCRKYASYLFLLLNLIFSSLEISEKIIDAYSPLRILNLTINHVHYFKWMKLFN